jgi:hypothetical protein
MFLAIVTLLAQPLALPQNALPQDLTAPVTALAASAAPSPSAINFAPDAEADAPAAISAAGPVDAAPASAASTPGLILIPEFRGSAAQFAPEFAAIQPSRAVLAAVRSVAMEQQEERNRRRLWIGLSAVQHGAAGFDAWSTRRAISSGAGRELNPMLRPFAGNNSLYVAIQAGPALLDYVGRRMMTSRHAWARHTWWLPQALGTAMSLASGINNLGVHAAH